MRPIVFISCLAVLLQTDVSWAREWLVERVSGTAWSIDTAATRTELKAGMEIEEGLTIATARNGRVRLSAENNVMTLGPGSVAAVKPKSFFSAKTEVLQQVGSIEFDIEKRDRPHFTVQTPFMAAVVKGTAFTIAVSRTDARIGVDRGLVQVQDLRSGETAGVAAGQRASVSAKATGLQTA
ncbi:FecR domain-containing protein, partial [Aureimonas sp. AU4]|uniref:FecR domain-containing protein n=1 Tax=Aureimonas sp. AU4 TaxID=1638163 RepID=UPI00178CD11B